MGRPGNGETDAILAAKSFSKTDVVHLLERFKNDASKTRSEVRNELGITGQYYAFIHFHFSLTFWIGEIN